MYQTHKNSYFSSVRKQEISLQSWDLYNINSAIFLLQLTETEGCPTQLTYNA